MDNGISMQEPGTEQQTGTVAPPPAQVIAPAHTPTQTASIGIGSVVTIAFFVALITTSAVVVAYDYYLAQKIVTADVKGYLLTQQSDFITGKITEAQLKDSFGRLEATLQAVPKNKTIIMGDAVVRGGEAINLGGNPNAKK